MTHRLCYVKHQWAYFTERPLTGPNKQWGDDWDDAPYEHNASPPYEEDDSNIKLVAFKCDLLEPCDYMGSNSPFSVEQINHGVSPWLFDYYGDSNEMVMAGCTLEDFISTIKRTGGKVYVEYS